MGKKSGCVWGPELLKVDPATGRNHTTSCRAFLGTCKRAEPRSQSLILLLCSKDTDPVQAGRGTGARVTGEHRAAKGPGQPPACSTPLCVSAAFSTR